MKKLFIALVIMPLVAAAQGAPGTGAGPGPGNRAGPGQGNGQRPGMGMGQRRADPERAERRMRLARTLGLAEALDLDPAQALKLGEQVAKFDEKRLAAHKQLREAHDALRRAASGEKVAPAEVDQAIQRTLAARTQLQAIDRDVVATVTKDLAPEKRARAVLFLERFQGHFGQGMGMGRAGRGHHMRGMRGDAGGMGGMGMMGMGASGACSNPDCAWMDDDDAT
jgi:hypothetical protein